MRHHPLFLCIFTLVAATGCQQASLTGLARDVVVTTLPAGTSAGRYEATVVASSAGTYATYMGLLMDHASKACQGKSYSVEDGTWGPDVDSRVPEGEKLRMVVSCNHDRLPNHREVAADDSTLFSLPKPEGSLVKSASQQLVPHRGNTKMAVESLLGGFLREAYTEQCAGKAVLVQYLGTATSPGTPEKNIPDPENMQATMHYQCVDAPAGTGGTGG